MSDRRTAAPVVEPLEDRRLMAASYTIIDLAPLEATGGAGLEGGDYNAPDINAAGSVGGTGLKPNGITNHGSLRLVSKGTVKWIDVGNFALNETSRVNGINDLGQLAGAYELGSATDHAYFAQLGKGGKVVLTKLGDFKGLDGTTAYALNNKGTIVGSAGMLTGSEQATMWQFNKKGRVVPTLLPRLGSGFGVPGMEAMSIATDVNDKGIVAGMAVDKNLQQRAALWMPGKKGRYGVVGLPGLGGASGGFINGGFASAINENNLVVGKAVDGSMKFRPAAWVPGKKGAFSIVQLGAPKGSTGEGAAKAVNDKGIIVGYTMFGTEEHATMWVPGKKGRYTPVDLNAYVPKAWSVNEATGINNAGTIVGYATRPGSATFMLVPKGVGQMSEPSAAFAAAAPKADVTTAPAPQAGNLFSRQAVENDVLA